MSLMKQKLKHLLLKILVGKEEEEKEPMATSLVLSIDQPMSLIGRKNGKNKLRLMKPKLSRKNMMSFGKAITQMNIAHQVLIMMMMVVHHPHQQGEGATECEPQVLRAMQ